MRNPRVVAVAGLHQRRHRRAEALTLVEGPAQIADAARAGASVVEVFALAADDVPAEVDAPLTVVTQAVLERMAGTVHPRGPLAVAAVPAPASLRTADTVVLWDVADPGNAGAIVRSAAAFGFDVAVTAATTDVWAPKAVRAAAATQFRTAIVELDGDPLPAIREAGLTVLAAVVDGGEDIERINLVDPAALLIGPEAHGLPDAVIAATRPISLHLDNEVESLNAAVAAGVLMHQIRRGRRKGSS